VAAAAQRVNAAWVRYRTERVEDERWEAFEATQRFLSVVYTPAHERRLSRYAFLARK
jgi:hypothetical protein